MLFDRQYFQKRGSLFPTIKALFYSALVKLAFRPKTLLDVGCARGEFVRFTTRLGIDSYGVDISEAAISQVPPYLKERCLVGDISELPFNDDRFDLVTSFATLEHISQEKSERVIKELLRVSRKKVFLQICVCDSPLERKKHYLLDPTHVNVQTSAWWKDKFSEWSVDYREICPRLGVFILTV